MASLRRASSAPLRFLLWLALALGAFLTFSPNAGAQSPTRQRVYGAVSTTTTTASLPAYIKDGTTGSLTAMAGSPFANRLEGGLLAIDGQGRYLFVLNPVNDNISMFQIDTSSGALTEVPNSPFAVGATINPNMAPSQPVSLATEVTGSFLYVGYASGDSNSSSAVVPFSIDAASLGIVLTPQLSMDIQSGAPIQMLTDPKGLRLYVGLGPAPYQSAPGAGTLVYSIDSASGVLTQTGMAGGGSEWGRAIAIDPQGRFFYDAWGQTEGFLDSGAISPVDGTSGATFTLDLGPDVLPSVLLTESSGRFLYVQTPFGLQIYAVDQTSGALTLVNGPVTSFAFEKGTVAADPMGPYIYSLGKPGVDAFQIDPQNGNLSEVPGSPFAAGSTGGSLGLAISGTAAQNESGPAAELFPTTTNLGQYPEGQSSATKIVSLVNTGSQILAVNGISITGINAGDFAQSSTCGATLAPNANCSISVVFTASQDGTEQAMLQVTDNAAGSPQNALLTGTGVATSPSIAFTPGSLDFGTVLQGMTATPKTIQLTNSGSGALHVTTLAFSGANPGDFSQTNTCLAGPVAVQASCSVTVVFAPSGQGQRTASLVVTDDAGNSPQSIALTGALASPFQMAAAPAGSTSATVSAGQPAQFALQLTPGPGFTGAITLTCIGAPLGALCGVSPASMKISNANAVPFQVTVTTSGGASTSVTSLQPPGPLLGPLARVMIAMLVMGIGLVVIRKRTGRVIVGLPRIVVCAAVALQATAILAQISGCGGGSSAVATAQTVTPKGTSTITVTAAASNVTPQTIQLTLTVN